MIRDSIPLLLFAAVLCGPTLRIAGARPDGDPVPLAGGGEEADDRVLEALLAPGEFPGRRFSFSVAGDEALFALDASLGSREPLAEIHPERVAWPRIAGLPLIVQGGPRKLLPARPDVSDADLDAGISARFTLAPIGQRFEPDPRFAVRLEAVTILSAADGRLLLSWNDEKARSACAPPAVAGGADCDLAGLGREARAAALSPDGGRLAVAVGGLRPRVEVYDLHGEPRRAWQSLFPARGGGPVDVAFSADGSFLAMLTGTGGLHRFDAITGSGHLAIPSAGRTACGVPPGHVMAVAGEEGEVTLWYLDDGTVAWRLPPRKVRGPVARLAASGDGRRLATLEYDEAGTVVRVWSIEGRTLEAQIAVEPYAVADIALDASGRRLFVSHERRGLMVADLDGDRRLAEAGGEAGALGLTRTRTAGPNATGLIVAAAAGSSGLAVVGEGHLLVWRGDGR
jgi:hypothetical protein